MQIQIRPARPEDAAQLPAIEASAGELFRTVPDLEWIADDDVLPVAAHLRLIAQGTVWVAWADPQGLLGFVSAEVYGDALHVWELAVAVQAQQMGIGKRLMRRAREYALERGLAAVTLTTFRDLPWNAPWYARLGFRPVDAARDPRLAGVLADEARHGLPAERRVAMRLRIAPAGD